MRNHIIDTNEPMSEHGSSRHERQIHKIFYLLLGVIGAGLVVLGYWALQNEKTLEIRNSPFPVRTIRSEASPAGVVILNVDYCKHTDIKGRLRMSFVSQSREIFLPVTEETNTEGCHVNEVPIILPKDIPADTYKVKFVVTYKLNPLKSNIPVEFESQTFKVSNGNVETEGMKNAQ